MKAKTGFKTQFKTNIVERYENGESSYQISENEGCSYNTVLRELKRRGVNTGLMFWTEEEIVKLKKIYPTSSNEELLKEFPNRNKKTIGAMAGKLGVKKKGECKEICKGCGEEFTIKFRGKYNTKGFCFKCVKKQWEHNHLKEGSDRKKQWIQRNPGYLKQYMRHPEVRKCINMYLKQLRKENPKYHLDCNIGMLVYHSLRDKKAGRRWETLVDYTLKDLMKHLESLFDENMTWENYGSYWHIDHIKPRSFFKYTSSDDQEFKKCWALENLQPLEKTANFRKNNKILQNNSVTGSQLLRHNLKEG